jgi:hypothetical protein
VINTQQKIRETTVAVTERANSPRSKFNPIRVFIDRDRLAWFWFIAAVVILVGAAADRLLLVRSFKQRERVVIIDPAGTFYVSPLLRFQEAKELHAQQSSFATIAFLERNPKGFDYPELLNQMFLKHAFNKALTQRSSEEAEFKAKQLHQKVEIGRIDILETREDYVLTQVNGQLIRAGIFQDQPFTEAIPFKLSLKLQRNPNMVLNGRFPTAISNFKYEPVH